VEIEAYYPDREAGNAVQDELPRGVGVTTDGSINHRNGFEIQTTKLAGTKGEKVLKNICEIVNSNGCKVEASCGLHLHIDGKGIVGSVIAQKLLWQFYAVVDDILMGFLPKSRRQNKFCIRLLRKAGIDEIGKCGSQDMLEQLWYKLDNLQEIRQIKNGKYHDTRYYGVNLHSLFANGHYEVRYHSGTTNFMKISQWANLHLRIADAVISKTDDMEMFINTVLSMPDMQEKRNAMYKFLELNDEEIKYWEKRWSLFSPVSEKGEELLIAVKKQ